MHYPRTIKCIFHCLHFGSVTVNVASITRAPIRHRQMYMHKKYGYLGTTNDGTTAYKLQAYGIGYIGLPVAQPK